MSIHSDSMVRVSFSFLPKGVQNEIVWIIGGASTYSCAKHGARNLVESGTFFCTSIIYCVIKAFINAGIDLRVK